MNSNKKAELEAILFAVGDMVEVEELAEALEVPADEVQLIAKELMEEYNEAKRGVQIIELGGGYQLSTKPECYPAVRKLLEPRRRQGLSGASLEALSIVAYNQPVTKSTVEFIRGVDCTYVMNKLLERGFIEEAGRLDAPGKPILYCTTVEFLRTFGLKSLDELPELQNPMIDAERGEEGQLSEASEIEMAEPHEIVENDSMI